MTANYQDRLDLLHALAADQGRDLCPGCLQQHRRAAGIRQVPLRDAGDLSEHAAAAVELLTAELQHTDRALQSKAITEHDALLRVLEATRITLVLLPAVMHDWDARFTLTLDDEGTAPPPPTDHSRVLGTYAARLRAHLQENDHQDWVDPNVIAGDVANVHDYALHILLWLEMFDQTGNHHEHHGNQTDQ